MWGDEDAVGRGDDEVGPARPDPPPPESSAGPPADGPDDPGPDDPGPDDTDGTHDVGLSELATTLRVELGRLNRVLRQHSVAGLTPSQLSAVAALDRYGPLRLGELARAEAVAPPTLTKLVAGLEGEGLVTRRPDPTDGRSWVVELAPKGRDALVRSRTERTAYLVERLAALDESDRELLARAAEVLARLIERDRGAP
jgi:DNA-binding MarR family transcriptional regulator